ncbi:hypothetical protein [Bradyrhizobium sp. USDA 3364]
MPGANNTFPTVFLLLLAPGFIHGVTLPGILLAGGAMLLHMIFGPS